MTALLRRIVALVAALAALAAPLSALPTVQKPSHLLDVNPGKLIPEPGGSKLVLSAPFLTVGGGFLPDANTVSNVIWDPWQIQTDPNAGVVGLKYRAVAWNGSLFAMVGNDGGGGGKIISSPDGVTWTTRLVGGGNMGVVVWDGTKFIAMCNTGCAQPFDQVSSDGITWGGGGNIPNSQTIYGMASNGSGTVVGVGTGGGGARTTDHGATWAAITLPSATTYNGIAWNGSVFATVGNSVAATSTDGVTWTPQTVPAVNWNAVVWSGTKFVAVGSNATNSVITSTDGVTWTTRTTPSANLFNVVWNGSFFFALGDASVAVTSTDGVTWTQRQFPYAVAGANGSSPAIAWNGTRFAIAANSTANRILTATVQEAKALPGSLVDSSNNVWTQNGTVPQVTTSPWYPRGFSSAALPGAGPYSDANYYSLGTGSDVLDFTGDFSCCLIYSSNVALGINTVLLSDGSSIVAGYVLQVGTDSTKAQIATYATGTFNSLPTTNSIVLNGMNTACYGRAGANESVKLNLGSIATAAAAAITPGTAFSAKIGRYEAAGLASAAALYGEWCSSTTPTDALWTSIQNRLFGHVTATGQTLTVTRATTATAEPKISATPSLYTYPANILRITENGALIEAAATNYVLQSQALDNVAWTSTTTVTADQYAAPDGTTTGEKVVSAVNTQTTQQAVTAASSTVQTASAWVRSDTGTVAMTVGVDHATVAPSACTCAVSSGACTAAISANKCFAYSTVGVTFTRLSATATYAAAQTAEIPFVTAGQYGTSTGTGGVWGAQLESGGYASSYVPTTTATIARNADVVSVANPLPVGPFCVTGTWVPALSPFGTWALGTLGATRDLWVFGTAGAANSARARAPVDGSIVFEVVDGAAASKTWTVAAGALTGSNSYTITACSDNAGTGTITLNGTAQSVTAAGAGTGVLSTLNAVSETGTATAVKNVKICKTAVAAACQ